MSVEQSIPIVVGVSGHRALRAEDHDTLYAAVTRELNKLKERCPHSPLVLLTSLAEGGDLLCADAAAALNIPIVAALPMERGQFTQNFSEADRARFDAHCAKAEAVFVTPWTEPSPAKPDKDFLYRQNGIYVSAHSHILLALWDGDETLWDGCGTAAAVAFSLRGAYRPKSGVALRSADNAAVLHIMTPRAGATGAAGEARMLGNEAALDDILARTDEFNRLAAGTNAAGRLLPEHEPNNAVLDRLEVLYHAADALSLSFAKKYRRVLALLAAASTVVAAAFLLYDEVGLSWMLFFCGAMLLGAWACRRYAVKSDCHRRYIEYRALAEGLRVQAFLRYAGSALEAAKLFSWTQQTETAWVMDVLCALTVGQAPHRKHDVRACWAEEQRAYHQSAKKKALRKSLRSDRIVSIALVVSVALYGMALAFELLFGGLVFSPVMPISGIDLWRVVLKVSLGSVSAATLFIANYYGKLSLPRQLADHTKMARFFAKMSEKLASQGQTDELLAVLAREELAENGNWCSYQRDNTPDISL